MANLKCIECGKPAAELYKDYKLGITKISHCADCGNIVDKYVEYEPVLIFLDTLLHKVQAYRHLLHNVHLQHKQWKLSLIYILCDTYLKWDQLYARRQTHHQMDEHIFYAALEYQFYMCFFVSIIDFSLMLVLLLVYIRLRTASNDSGVVVKAILVSSYGKLLAIPAIIWGQTDSALCLLLTHTFIVTSNVSALRAVTDLGRKELLLLLTTMTVMYMLLSYQLTEQLLVT